VSDIPAALFFEAPPPTPDTFNVVAYGPSGAGKSTLAATAPGPILWVNFDGPGALAFPRTVAAARGTEIRELAIPRHEDPRPILRSAYQYLRGEDGADVQTVVIDPLGKLRDHLQRAIAGGDQPTFPQWGEIGRIIEDFVGSLRDLPVNVILVCHEDISDSDDGDRVVRPLIGGKTTEKVLSEMDVVAYVNVRHGDDAPEYLAQFVETRGRRAKDRSGGLGLSRSCDVSEWLAVYRQALEVRDDDVPIGPEKPVQKSKAKQEAAA